MTPIEIRVIGIPQPQGNKTAFNRGGKIVMTEGRDPAARRRFHDWRDGVKLAAVDWIEAHGNPPAIDEPMWVSIQFWLPRPKSAAKRVLYPTSRPDLDKLGRSVLDALTQAGLIADDSRVVTLWSTKRFAIEEAPGCRIYITGAPQASSLP